MRARMLAALAARVCRRTDRHGRQRHGLQRQARPHRQPACRMRCSAEPFAAQRRWASSPPRRCLRVGLGERPKVVQRS